MLSKTEIANFYELIKEFEPELEITCRENNADYGSFVVPTDDFRYFKINVIYKPIKMFLIEQIEEDEYLDEVNDDSRFANCNFVNKIVDKK